MDLRELEIQFTTDCNMRCIYCGNRATWSSEGRMFSNEMLKALLETTGINFVKIGGGEPLIHLNELLDILRLCNSFGVDTQVDTNGTLVTREVASKLAAAGLGKCRISIYSKQFERFFSVRKGSSSEFELSLAAPSYLTAVGIDTIIDTVVTTINQDEILDLNLWCRFNGISEHWIECGEPAGRASWDLLLTPHELASFLQDLFRESDPETTIVVHCCQATPCSPFSALYEQVPKHVRFDPCIIQSGRLHIDAFGRIFICDIGNLGNPLGTFPRDNPVWIAEHLENILSYRSDYLDACIDAHPNTICKNWCGIPFALFDGPDSVWEQYDLHICAARQSEDPVSYTENWRSELKRLELKYKSGTYGDKLSNLLIYDLKS